MYPTIVTNGHILGVYYGEISQDPDLLTEDAAASPLEKHVLDFPNDYHSNF